MPGMSRRPKRFFSFPAVTLAALLFLAGCAPDGEALLRSEECLECHRFRGEGGYLGPDLTAVAARSSTEWMMQQVKNSKENDPSSRMPAYDKLSSREIRAIVTYLKSKE